MPSFRILLVLSAVLFLVLFNFVAFPYNKILSHFHQETFQTIKEATSVSTAAETQVFRPPPVDKTLSGRVPSDDATNELSSDKQNATFFCVSWNQAMDDWWTHHPDWDVVQETNDGLCFQRMPADDEKTLYFTKMYRNQHLNNCTNVYTRYMWCSGWNADFLNVRDGIRRGLELGRPLAIQLVPYAPWWHYSAVKKDGSNPTCPKKDMSCYFLNLTNCEAATNKTEIDQNGGVYEGDKYSEWILEYVTRPQQWLRKAVHEYLRENAPVLDDSNCSVIHVRRSDVVLHGKHSRKYLPVSDYIDKLPQDRKQAGSTVLLLTDDANAIDEAHEFFPDLNWEYLNRTRHRGAEGGWENQTPSKSPKAEVIQILATFRLVQQCDMFVYGRSGFSGRIRMAMEQVHGSSLKSFELEARGGINASSTELEVQLNKLRQKRKSLNIQDSKGKAMLPFDGQNTTFFCVSWNQTVDDWWTHHPDWDVVQETDDGLCFQRMPADDEKTLYFTKMYQNQHLNNCTNVYTRYMWCSGWNADFLNVRDGIRRGLELGRPLAIQLVPYAPWWHYSAVKKDGSNPTCPKKDMSCYFLNLTNCEAATNKTEIDQNGGVYEGDKYSEWILEYVTRPQQWLRKAVHEYLRENAPVLDDSNCSVIHVRRSDVVLHGKHSRKYLPVSDYIDKLPQDRKQAGSTVLLLTDDANAIDEAHEFFPDLNWEYLNRTRHRGAEGGWENQTPSKSPKAEVIQILATFRLVQQCDMFVYGRSGFSRRIRMAMEQVHGTSLKSFELEARGGINASSTDLEVQLNKLRQKRNAAAGPA